MLIWRVMGNPRRTMESGLGMISPSILIQKVSSRSSPSTTARLFLPHWQTLIMIAPEITPGHDWIDLHLGQKPKLGEVYRHHTLIYISYSVGTLYIHVSFSFFLFVVSCFVVVSQNTKRPKIFLLFLFVYLFHCWSLVLVCLVFILVAIRKIQKHFALLLAFFRFFCSCLKFENPKIFVVILLFCKVCCRVQQPSVTPLELGIHFILFKPQVKSNYDDL